MSQEVTLPIMDCDMSNWFHYNVDIRNPIPNAKSWSKTTALHVRIKWSTAVCCSKSCHNNMKGIFAREWLVSQTKLSFCLQFFAVLDLTWSRISRDRCFRVPLPWPRPPRLKAQVVDLPVELKDELLKLEFKKHRRMLQQKRHFIIELSVWWVKCFSIIPCWSRCTK